MGLFKSIKEAKSPEAKYAQERLSKGHTVLIQQVESGSMTFRSPEKLVEETEAEGWRLEQLCAVPHPHKNKTLLFFLFRPARGVSPGQEVAIAEQVPSSANL
jgi:hypothetical protein